MKIALVGAFGGINVAGSLYRAARSQALEVVTVDVEGADSSNRLLRSLSHRFDKRRAHMRSFSKEVVDICWREQPDLLIATGTAPLTGADLLKLRRSGVLTANYSTDDPWNASHKSRWHLEALQCYDFIFTTRKANIADFAALGCKSVHYMPFAYDPQFISSHPSPAPRDAFDVLFVGGADRDRAKFMREYLCYGPGPTLVGGYWHRYSGLASYAKGIMDPAEISALTKSARVNVCLVRRANRDGHVMRTFEIAAIGGCMLAEDTAEHRDIFGCDGECVRYFRTPKELAAAARDLIADERERARLSRRVQELVLSGRHSYEDRLLDMISICSAR